MQHVALTLASGTARTGIPASAVAVVLLAAVTHAVWNALAHAVRDKLTLTATLGAGTAGISVVLLVFLPAPPAVAWPYIAASAGLHVVYNVLLLFTYRIGEFSQVYPVARGTSPWVVAIAGALLVGDRLSGVATGGVVVISVGLMSLVVSGRHRSLRADLPALGAAVATGCTIAAYTVVDGIGVRHAGGAAPYAGWMFFSEGALTLAVAMLMRRGRPFVDARQAIRVGPLCAALSIIAYGLVLWAQTQGALAAVAALRETSVIAGAIIGAVFFHEGFGRGRILGAVLVVAGIAMIELG